MNVCLYVCLYLIQIHISEPIGTKLRTRLPRGLEETVGYEWAHNISPFPPFQPILLWAGADPCTVAGCRRHTAPLLRYIHDVARAGVTSRTVGCAIKMRRSEQNACVWKWKPDETGWKWLMNWTCNCIAFIQMITYNLSNLRPSFFRSLSTDNTFFHLLNLSHRSARCFAKGMTTQCCNPDSHVCVCVGSPCVYTPSSTSSPCFVLSGKCFANGMTTLGSMLLTWACSRVGNPTNIYIPAPEGKTKNFSDISNRR